MSTSEKKSKRSPRLRGFASVVKSQLDILNKIPRFQENFADEDLKILLESTDLYPAALVHVNHGSLVVTGISQEQCNRWKKTGAKALLRCTMEQFLTIATGKLNPAKAWLRRQVKIRGPRKLLLLSKLFTYISKHKEEQKKAKEAKFPAETSTNQGTGTREE